MYRLIQIASILVVLLGLTCDVQAQQWGPAAPVPTAANTVPVPTTSQYPAANSPDYYRFQQAAQAQAPAPQQGGAAAPAAAPAAPAVGADGLPAPRTPEEAALRTEIKKLEEKTKETEQQLGQANSAIKAEENELKFGNAGGQNAMPNVEKTMMPVSHWVDKWLSKARAVMDTPADDAAVAVGPILDKIKKNQQELQQQVAEQHHKVIEEMRKAEEDRVAAELEKQQKDANAREAALMRKEEEESAAEDAAAMDTPCCKELAELKAAGL